MDEIKALPPKPVKMKKSPKKKKDALTDNTLGTNNPLEVKKPSPRTNLIEASAAKIIPLLAKSNVPEK